MADYPLTDVKVRKLKSDPGKRIEVWDSKFPGFGMRISPKGTKSFVLLYRQHGRSRRMTLGRYPAISLSDARQLARDTLNQVAKGEVPENKNGNQKKTAGVSYRFDACVEDFVARHCSRHNKASTAHETERLLRRSVVPVWAARNIREIKKPDIIALLDGIVDQGFPSAANHAYAAIRKFFNWCTERGMIEVSPCTGIKMPSRPVSRSRVLGDDELGEIWRTAGQQGFPFGAIVQLLILTGQRRSEVARMTWEDIDLEEALWTIPPEQNKSNRAHSVPLCPQALKIIENTPSLSDRFLFPSQRSPDRTFSGFSKSKRRLDVACGISEWTLHDLRRTLATGLARLEVQPHVVEKLLNHTTGTFGGVAGVYNRFGYLPEIRDALLKWEKHVTGL